MTTMTPVMPEAHDWTVDDLDLLPDDGLQRELLDGLLLVTPAPVYLHQLVSHRLSMYLEDACTESLQVLCAPLDWRPDSRTSLQPDLLVVVPPSDVLVASISAPPLLVVEIRSPSTRRKDRDLKWSKYQDEGIESYWIVDPNEPSITAWQLVEGRYAQVGQAAGAETLSLEHPFPIEITPARLRRH